MNTYGLFSINSASFNQYWDGITYRKRARDIIVSLFKIHNLSLNFLGYSKYSKYSGIGRIGSGLTLAAVTLCVGERNSKGGVIIGRWYDEALLMATAQIARGILEAFVPYGKQANFALDVIGTIYNLTWIVNTNVRPGSFPEPCYPPIDAPHEMPNYPFIFWLLHLV